MNSKYAIISYFSQECMRSFTFSCEKINTNKTEFQICFDLPEIICFKTKLNDKIHINI